MASPAHSPLTRNRGSVRSFDEDDDDVRLNNDRRDASSSPAATAAAPYYDNEDDSSITSNSYVTANSSVISSSKGEETAPDLVDAVAATMISNLDGVNITAGATGHDNASATQKRPNVIRR